MSIYLPAEILKYYFVSSWLEKVQITTIAATSNTAISSTATDATASRNNSAATTVEE